MRLRSSSCAIYGSNEHGSQILLHTDADVLNFVFSSLAKVYAIGGMSYQKMHLFFRQESRRI